MRRPSDVGSNWGKAMSAILEQPLSPPAQAVPEERGEPAPSAGGGIAPLVLQLVAQLPGIMFVDPVLALLRRRPIGVSVGRRIRKVLAGFGPMYDKLAQLLASHAA